MHVVWPKGTPNSPWVSQDVVDPYDAESEPSPLGWHGTDTFISRSTLSGLGLMAEYAFPYQGSYWPNEPPVLPPTGYIWYNYGPLTRGIDLWKAIPATLRPSAEEQKAFLKEHRKNFAGGRLPEGLAEAMAKHGLSADQHWLTSHFSRLTLGWLTIFAVGWIVQHAVRHRK